MNKIKRSWQDNAIILCLTALSLLILGQTIGIIIVNIFREIINLMHFDVISNRFWEMSINYLFFIGIWLVLILIFNFNNRNKPILNILWKKPKGNKLNYLIIGLLIGAGLNAICVLAAYLHGDIKLVFSSFPFLKLLIMFVFTFIQSSSEEFLCRGYLYQRLVRGGYSILAVIIINSAFFSVLHLLNPGITLCSILNIFLVGILCSLCIYYFDSLWLTFAIHSAWNFTQNIVFGLPNSGVVSSFSIYKLNTHLSRNSFAYDTIFGIEGTFFSIFILGLSCLFFYTIGKKIRRKPINLWNKTNTDDSVAKLERK